MALSVYPGALRSGWTSYATAINDRGQVIGHSERGSGPQHGFLWHNGRMLDLGGVPAAINNHGQIVGTTYTSGLGRAFLWLKGRKRDLGALGGRASFAAAINERGQIVGMSGHAFVWQNGTMTELGTLPGDNSSQAIAINNHGQIVGISAYTTKAWQPHAVLWTLKQG